jgi:CDP-diacylglycerol--glycerol-3-phosphate 3-phosphatidyltransferase
MSDSPEQDLKVMSDDVHALLAIELRRIALLGGGLLALWTVAVAEPLGVASAVSWFLLALGSWGFVLWQCYRRLSLNRSAQASGTCYPALGHGNRITLFRGLLIAATAGYLVVSIGDVSSQLLYAPAAFYTLAAAGDWLDGYMARRQQQTTQLGMELDTVLDAFGLLMAPALAVLAGKLHASYLLVSVAYYLFQWGIDWRERQGRPVFALPPSRIRRYLAGLQMALVAIALWPFVPASLSTMVGIALMIPLLVGFCRDWLHVSGQRGEGRERVA